jgi:hypothetical protein
VPSAKSFSESYDDPAAIAATVSTASAVIAATVIFKSGGKDKQFHFPAKYFLIWFIPTLVKHRAGKGFHRVIYFCAHPPETNGDEPRHGRSGNRRSGDGFEDTNGKGHLYKKETMTGRGEIRKLVVFPAEHAGKFLHR